MRRRRGAEDLTDQDLQRMVEEDEAVRSRSRPASDGMDEALEDELGA
jgi:hypothetical protein